MQKYIYKITNQINGLIYIGQTNNPNRRWREHQLLGASNQRKHSLLYNAIHKYGVHNFIFEVIEGPIENYNEREKYWISYYDSQNKEKGYNLTPGGEEPPVSYGENSNLSTYSDEIISNIQLDLLKNELSFQDISNKYNISVNYLYGLNQGKIRRDNNFSYPLRANGNERLDQDIVEQVLYDLLYTTKTIEEICKEFSIKDKVVRKINNGEHFYCLSDLQYPIRAPFNRISNYLLLSIYDDLLDNKLKMSDIEQKYNLSKPTISRINLGKRYKQENFSYPLRPSSRRVYN